MIYYIYIYICNCLCSFSCLWGIHTRLQGGTWSQLLILLDNKHSILRRLSSFRGQLDVDCPRTLRLALANHQWTKLYDNNENILAMITTCLYVHSLPNLLIWLLHLRITMTHQTPLLVGRGDHARTCPAKSSNAQLGTPFYVWDAVREFCTTEYKVLDLQLNRNILFKTNLNYLFY